MMGIHGGDLPDAYFRAEVWRLPLRCFSVSWFLANPKGHSRFKGADSASECLRASFHFLSSCHLVRGR